MTNTPPQSGQDATPTQDMLKPCPFCSSVNIDAKGWASQNSSGPACDDCGASAGSTLADTPEANIAAWNTRPTAPATAELDEYYIAAIWHSAINAYDHDGTGDRDDDAAIADLHQSLAALRQRSPAPSEPICETCGLATSHPNASFCSDGFHQPALDPYTLEHAARYHDNLAIEHRNFASAVGSSIESEGRTRHTNHANHHDRDAAAIRALIPTSEGDTK